MAGMMAIAEPLMSGLGWRPMNRVDRIRGGTFPTTTGINCCTVAMKTTAEAKPGLAWNLRNPKTMF
jgi:hypothetical protein